MNRGEADAALRSGGSGEAMAPDSLAHREVESARRKRTILIVAAHVLFVVLVALILTPGQKYIIAPTGYDAPMWLAFLVAVCLIEVFYLYRLVRNRQNAVSSSWIVIVVWAILILWEYFTTQTNQLQPVLFPAPEAVFTVFPTQWPQLLVNVGSSLELLAVGAVTSIVLGVVFGALVGWIPGLRDVCAPIARVLAPIPSVVFAPYLVAIMPTFRSASAMVVFLGLFWPTFLNTIIRVGSIDRHIVESARMLELNGFAMVREVILPYLLPGVINGLNGQLTSAIMMLTFAEMLGAKSGMGYYIINYTNFGNYVNVVAGIVVVGIVVTLLNWIINSIKRHVVKWR